MVMLHSTPVLVKTLALYWNQHLVSAADKYDAPLFETTEDPLECYNFNNSLDVLNNSEQPYTLNH